MFRCLQSASAHRPAFLGGSIAITAGELDRIERDFRLPVHAEDLPSFFEDAWVDDKTWIIPAVPVHFAFAWLLHELQKTGCAEPLPVPETVTHPNPQSLPGAQWFALRKFCHLYMPGHLQRTRCHVHPYQGPTTWKSFRRACQDHGPGCDVIVIRKLVLAPGVGGYPGSILKGVLDKITNGPEGCRLIATSCRCHGVIDALRWQRG